VFAKGSLLLGRPDIMVELRTFIEDNKIDFVLVDSVRRSILGDENDSSVTNRVFQATKLFRDTYNCGFVFLAHWRKPKEDSAMNNPTDMLKGSTDWRNMCDQHMAVVKATLPDHIDLIPDKSRHAEDMPDKFTVKFEHDDRTVDNGPFKMVYVPDDGQATADGAVLGCVKAYPGVTRRELVEHLGLSPKQVRQSTERLLAYRKIQADHIGKGSNPIKYEVMTKPEIVSNEASCG
jgi:hypothetical protein